MNLPKTRDEALRSLAQLEVALSGAASKGQRAQLTRDKMLLQGLLGTTLSARNAEAVVQKARKDKTTIRAAPQYSDADLYVGPRCEYCGYPRPMGYPCMNEGPDYPHPPGLTP